MSFAREGSRPDPEGVDGPDPFPNGRSVEAGSEQIGPRHSAGLRREDDAAAGPPPGTLASSSLGGEAPTRRRRRPGRRTARSAASSAASASGSASGSTSGSRSARPGPARAMLGVLGELVTVLAMAVVLSLVIKTFLVQAFFIPSQSMEATLMTGDRVVVSKLTPGPFELHRGDIVVFKDPGGWLQPVAPIEDAGLHKLVREAMTFVGLLPQDSGEHLIKRVIGLPGDTVRCCDDAGRLVVDDTAVQEPYLYPGDLPSETEFSVQVPAGHLWVMGDHRSVSKDSRYNQVQFVPIDDVVGKAFVTVWPLDRLGGLQVADGVFAALSPDGAS